MFASRVLAPAEASYAPTEGEALAIQFGLKRFAHLLYGQRVRICTDHRPLTFVKQGSETNRKLARWWMELQEFNYELEYITSKTNFVADCLSRMTCNRECVTEADSLG